jgi:peptidyl-prolyl cis-trans isomerase B (cyclophilin B)
VLPADAAGGYSVIGQVTTGLDQLVAQITSAGIVDGQPDGAPVVPTTITSFTIQ